MLINRRKLLDPGLRSSLLLRLPGSGQNASPDRTAATPKSFPWPQGKRAAISLSFDEARPSQVDAGLDLLDKCGVKASFYVLPKAVKERLGGWKRAVAGGHEIGNHTMSHPCAGSYDWSVDNPVENYSLQMIAKDIDDANTEIIRLLGVTPRTFAYPCGQLYVGRGRQAESYVHLVAERFIVGRGPNSDTINNPGLCDLSKVYGMAFNRMDYNGMLKQVSETVHRGWWTIFVGYEISDRKGSQVTATSALQALCRHISDPSLGIWVDTVEHVGRYIQQVQAESAKSRLQEGAQLRG
ncbi:MAG: polysaccharide deacetylase family protein [Terriglobia bacterium]|jgi:peptidoglycan/xylan/chitin deacetylase (PgdA/CDA1 family)